MARPLPVNMLLAGTGAVLLVSGIGGQPLSEVLKGSFGKLQTNPEAGSEGAGQKSAANQEEGQQQFVSDEEGAAAPQTFSSATVAPSPTSFSTRKAPTKRQQAQAIARILLSEGITHPTAHQLQLARAKYERETGVGQFASAGAGAGATEFDQGLPVI